MERVRDILSHNLGFDKPERWIDYARRKDFSPVRAYPIHECPDCGKPSDKTLGQYVYYSTLLRLRECRHCGLIWSDARIDEEIISRDFDRAYHEHPGREYFVVRRLPVFQYLAHLVVRAAPRRGQILDIGGAQGHLMRLVREWRPDLTTWVNDVSEAALQYAVERFRLPVIFGGIEELCAAGGKYHVVVMSDVLYYEPDLRRFWATLPGLLKPRGLLLIRMPNKLPLLRAAAWVEGLRNRATRHLQDRIRFFNPQHAYVMSPAYLYNRLRRLGFHDIRSGPSPMLGSPSHGVTAASRMVFNLLQSSGRVLGRSLPLTPSFVMSARWRG